MNKTMAAPAAGMMVDGEHVHPVRVYFEDTDAAGLVYYANYLKFAERARTEMMRDLGRSHSAMMAEHGLVFVVRHCTVDYRRPARLDDLLAVHTRIVQVGGASLEMAQSVRRDGEVLVDIDIRLVCISGEGTPARFPRDLRSVLTDLSHLNRQDG